LFRKDLIYMIELKIDSTKNELSLTHDVCCNEHLADELAIIIDIMIADYFIKNGHNMIIFLWKKKKKSL
jgi:hypothetical protein